VTPQDMSHHAQTCFNPLIAFFLTQVGKLLNTPRTYCCVYSTRILMMDRDTVRRQESSTVHAAVRTGYADCLLAGSGSR